MTAATLEHEDRPIAGTRVAIQGYGKVGKPTVQLLEELGCTVVAVSDVQGGIYNERGLDAEELVSHANEAGTVMGFKGADTLTNEELLVIDCDILIPAAMEGQLTEENASKVQASIIVEAANGPTTPEGDAILGDRGILVVPDILANSGGVTVSYFEWVQGLQAFFWDEEEVNNELKLVMDRAYGDVLGVAKQRGVSLRTAATILGVGRVAEAHKTRGLYP